MAERAFFVRPIDAVHFGSPTTSRAGDSHGGRSEFPPSPWAFQGMVRSRLLMAAHPPLDLDDWSSAAVDERERLIGTPDRLPEGWRIAGPFPACFDEDGSILEPWLPNPRYLFTDAGQLDEDRACSRCGAAWAEIVEPPPLPTDDTVPYGDVRTDIDPEAGRNWLVGLPKARRLGPTAGWLSASDFHDVLSGLEPSRRPAAQPPFVRSHLKTGLGLESSSKTAKGSMLYTRGYLRFRDGSGLLGIFSGTLPPRIRPDALETGTGQAGRGARPVAFERVPVLHEKFHRLQRGAHLPAECERDPYPFWLVLATPARVAAGVPGEPIDPLNIASNALLPAGVRLTVRAAIAGPPIVLGGFRMASGNTRLAHNHVPAGSAWRCEVTGGTPASRAQALRGLNDNSLGPREDSFFGFGHAFVGLLPSARERS